MQIEAGGRCSVSVPQPVTDRIDRRPSCDQSRCMAVAQRMCSDRLAQIFDSAGMNLAPDVLPRIASSLAPLAMEKIAVARGLKGCANLLVESTGYVNLAFGRTLADHRNHDSIPHPGARAASDTEHLGHAKSGRKEKPNKQADTWVLDFRFEAPNILFL